MKFFLCFVSCSRCTRVNPRSSSSVSSKSQSQSQSCVSYEGQSLEQQLRQRKNHNGKSGKDALVLRAEWRPSLCSIAEDGVLSEMHERVIYLQSEKRMKKKKKAEAEKFIVGRNHGFREPSFSEVVPAFSSTPFVF